MIIKYSLFQFSLFNYIFGL